MTSIDSELTWVKQLLEDLGIKSETSMKMYCNNQAAKYIVSNLIFHERTKHIEVNCHFIRKNIQTKEIKIPFIRSEDQFEDAFTKWLDPNLL
jgi:hypothetical protein